MKWTLTLLVRRLGLHTFIERKRKMDDYTENGISNLTLIDRVFLWKF